MCGKEGLKLIAFLFKYILRENLEKTLAIAQ